ncbi:MAG: threonylcarbamoyl-AMP synthase [Phycisphaerales bacterium]|nr:threonylcarbamoyl-AMP synthase [Planctomycetota bacterium]MCH8509774.1 threonylcarbamoyl-AMP synthase [Phycisphaerales bacterium]
MPEPRIVVGPEGIAAGVRALAAGGIIAFPTETVYGLGADAFNADAVARVFALKGRPSNNPLIVHVSGPEMARRVVADWPEPAQRLADAFWPGPLTLVLPKAPDLPDAVTASGPTVGVRCPDHPMALALIEAAATPIVGPSANPSGCLSPTTAEHVADAFPDADLPILDGGACRAGIESTVLDLTRQPARVLRPGVIGHEAIAAVLGGPVDSSEAEPAGQPADSPAASPGLLGPHYQPRTPVRLVQDARTDGIGPDEALLAWSLQSHPQGGVLIRMPADLAGFAAALYAKLHEADRLKAARIVIERPGPGADTASEAIRGAILERLSRAAGG